MGLNKVMLIGNVGRDPEIRYIDGQENPNTTVKPKVATFTLATSERYRDRSGNTQETTEWHNIVAWRSLADLAENYIKVGTQIYVEGKIRTRSWTDQSGAKRFTTEIVADTIQLLGRRSDSAQGTGAAPSAATPSPQQYQAPAAPAARPLNTDSVPDDDLPF